LGLRADKNLLKTVFPFLYEAGDKNSLSTIALGKKVEERQQQHQGIPKPQRAVLK